MSRLILALAVLSSTAAHARTLVKPYQYLIDDPADWLFVEVGQVGVGLGFSVRDWNYDNRWWIAPGEFWITRDSLDNLGITNGPWISYHDLTAFAAAESLSITAEHPVQGPGRNGTQVFYYNDDPITVTAFRAPEPSGLAVAASGVLAIGVLRRRAVRCG